MQPHPIRTTAILQREVIIGVEDAKKYLNSTLYVVSLVIFGKTSHLEPSLFKHLRPAAFSLVHTIA
jgi:hypothetical protein